MWVMVTTQELGMVGSGTPERDLHSMWLKDETIPPNQVIYGPNIFSH